MRRVLLVGGLVLALLVGGVAWYLAPIGPIATGYAAQIVCGAHVVAERPLDDAIGDLPDNPLVPYLRVNAQGPVVTATLLGAYESVAVRTVDGGCRLIEPGQSPSDIASDADLRPRPEPTADDLVVPTSIENEALNAGFDAALLDHALTQAFAEPATDTGAVMGTRAVLVVHQGTVVAERYADGFDETTPLLGWSMTKSIASAWAGMLVQRGSLDLDRASLSPWPTDGPRAAITVDHLLTMTPGLAFEEVYDPDTDATRMLFRPGDTGGYAAGLPLEHDPGTYLHYSSGTTNILCDVLVGVAGGDPSSGVHQVFDAIGMTSATVGTDVDGAPVCSSYGYATARDWARLGLWYLQDGVWGGERLLPEGWVTYSSTAVDVPDGDEPDPYGAGWWPNAHPDGTLRFPDVPTDAYWASGNEGQHVVVLPSHGLVVVRLGLTRGGVETADTLAPLVRDVVAALHGG